MVDKAPAIPLSSVPMTFAQVIKFFGGVGNTARALGLKQPSVSNWRTRSRKIPYLRQLHIERVTQGKLKADNNK